MHAVFNITATATQVFRLILTVVFIKLSQKSNISCYIVSFVIIIKSKCITLSCYVQTQRLDVRWSIPAIINILSSSPYLYHRSQFNPRKTFLVFISVGG